MKNRILSFLMCLAMLFSMFPPSCLTATAADQAAQAPDATPVVTVMNDGIAADSITMGRSEKRTLSVSVEGTEAKSYQWQILLGDSLWVNIFDKTAVTCEVSYALVKNMLDGEHNAYLRCAVASGTETLYSEKVCLHIGADAVSDEQAVALHAGYTAISKTVTTPVMLAVDGDEETEYVTVTVKYLDAGCLGGGEEVSIYSPYVATIEKGSAFNQSVVSPTFLGYAPYLDSNGNQVLDDGDMSAATVELSYANVTENIEIKVYYKPIEVNFAIKYFFQNINDDLYTEDASRYHTSQAETGAIVTNEYLLSHAGDTTGFSKMYHIPESVAADGSTVFECYYDRDYYLIQFDLNGGYGLEPIYARYGTPFVVNEPIRPGYRFTGWKLLCIDTNGNGEWDDALPGDATNNMITTVPPYNYYYQAQWQATSTTYTVAYWLQDTGSTYNYVGSKILPADANETVSGSNDIAGSNVCGLAEHSHSEANGCYSGCDLGSGDSCITGCYYNGDSLLPADNENDYNASKAYAELAAAVDSPINGNLYKYSYTGMFSTKDYYFFYLNGIWYSLGLYTDGFEYDASLPFTTSGAGTYATVPAIRRQSCTHTGEHTHTDACMSCLTEAHVHGDGCKVDTTYFVFEQADQNVTVKGDGSTVVNVYYKPKAYTLRFYYAATEGTGTDADSDGFVESYPTVKVIGGSTYSFGANGDNTSDDKTLLDNIFATNQAGEVTSLPQLNTEGLTRNYTHGTLVSGTTAYHYIEFTADYGQDISKLWPCSVFESVTRTTANTHGNWSGTEAFVSAWNGEHHVYYSQHPPAGNQTIKGKYEKLDYTLLFDSKYTDESTVSYLCFWENGANVGWSVPELYVYRIWVPVLPGDLVSKSTTTVDGLPVMEKDGVTYKMIDSYDTCDNSTVEEQTQPALEGYTASSRSGDPITLTDEQKKMYKEGYNVDFFYSRQQDNPFTMKNHGVSIVNIKANNGTGGVPYGTLINSLSQLSVLGDNYTPPYPSTLEENAYYFDGWYTTEQCVTGTKVELSTLTMPASGLMLYANWLPKTHTVQFFTTYDEMIEFEDTSTGTPYHTDSVLHGNVVKSVETPTLSSDSDLELIFSGWFYMENGQKQAFAPANMPVNRDLNVFAAWSSHTPQPYRIHYVLLSDPSVKVADDTTGYAYEGSTRTFTAKAGSPYNQLYGQYNDGYFPTVNSHSITIQAEPDKDALQYNLFTFYYVPASEISYTVRYVNKETNVVMDVVNHTTTAAVVTERYKPYQDMVADAFYKRLVLEVVWDEEKHEYVGTNNNVITFYYTPNQTTAYYAVHFMLEKLNAAAAEKNNFDISGNGGYAQTGTHEEGVGDIGSTVYITPKAISGFSLVENNKTPIIDSGGNQTVATKNGDTYGLPIESSGSEMYLFYRRNQYDYQVYYYEYNTTNALATETVGSAYYDAQVTQTAKVIEGYTCVSQQTQTITIRESSDSKPLNVIIFYYAPIQYVAEYVVVPDGGGWLTNTIEVISGAEGLDGSVPTANKYYEYVGWYLDEACTQSVDGYGTVDPSTHRFTPDKNKLSQTERNIFYCKFIKKAGDLTIVRSNATDADQVFIYEIRNKDTGLAITVTITGNDQVTIRDLPLGDYAVTQLNNWSWRYSDEGFPDVIHQNPAGTTVSFTKAAQTDQWLNGNSTVAKNQRG